MPGRNDEVQCIWSGEVSPSGRPPSCQLPMSGSWILLSGKGVWVLWGLFSSGSAWVGSSWGKRWFLFFSLWGGWFLENARTSVIRGSVYLSVLPSVHPLSVRLHPPHCVCSLCLRLYSYPANRFISAIFLDFHVCALIYDVHFPLSDFILYDRLHIHRITLNDRFIPFDGWVILHCICAAASLSIHLPGFYLNHT